MKVQVKEENCKSRNMLEEEEKSIRETRKAHTERRRIWRQKREKYIGKVRA